MAWQGVASCAENKIQVLGVSINVTVVVKLVWISQRGTVCK